MFDPYRLVSAVGALAMLGLATLLCRQRDKIRWRPVGYAVLAQWGLALLLLRVPQGRAALQWLAGGVTVVLEQSYAGSEFLFGELGKVRGGDSGLGVIFAFQVLPTIIFIATLFGVLYYVKVMPVLVRLMARAMTKTLGASGAESLSVAASVFMGQTEAPLTIRPFLARLTESELFLVMVSGMASVSGAILGAYVTIGRVPLEYLLTAVAMTAPISVAMAKIMLPETGTPETSSAAEVKLPPAGTNLLDAAARGATDGMKLAVNVGAMLIAFIALIALLNQVFGLITIGGEALTLERLMGWMFMPIALLLGTPASDAHAVGTVLGTRTVVNELVAFDLLRDIKLQLQTRSLAIATFAICGFANISSIGIQIGGLGALVPERKSDIARLGVRALVAATLANLSSAAVAGALI